MIFDILTPPQCPSAPVGGAIFSVARPTHVSNSHTKFGWISSNGLGGDSKVDGRMEEITISHSLFFFKKKRGDN